MSVTQALWGLILVAVGVFLTAAGARYYRYALAAIGFGVGFLGSIGFTAGQDVLTRFLLALLVGVIGAVLLYVLVQFGFIIAGVIAGLVAVLFVVGVLRMLGLDLPGLVVTLLALAGLVAGGYFGRELEDLAVLLATAAGGAYLIVSGIDVLFGGRGGEGAAPHNLLSQQFGLLLFVIVFAIGFLTQYLGRGRRTVARAR